MSITCLQSSSVISLRSPKYARPALLTRTSGPSQTEAIFRNMARTLSGSETSPGSMVQLPPDARISSFTSRSCPRDSLQFINT